MRFIVSEFAREDGVQALKSIKTGVWVIRKITGYAQFYNHINQEWQIAHTISDMSDFTMSRDKAIELLKTLPVSNDTVHPLAEEVQQKLVEVFCTMTDYQRGAVYQFLSKQAIQLHENASPELVDGLQIILAALDSD